MLRCTLLSRTDVQCHRSRDDGSHHQAAHVEHPVERVPKATIMQEVDISNDRRLNRLRRSSSDAIEHTSAHEGAVSHRLRSPDRRRKANNLRKDIHRPPTERRADGHPDEVAKPKHQDSHARELDNSRKARVEIVHVVREHGRESQRAEALRESDERGRGDTASLPERRPVQRIVLVGGRLWNQDSRAAFDEVVRADVCHDLCARENLSVELLLQSVELLLPCQHESV